jgi:hypothetical protein
MEQVDAAVARQWHGKHVSTARNNMQHKLLKAGKTEPEQRVIARQLHSTHISIPTNSDATTEDAMFSIWSRPRLYNKDQQQRPPCGGEFEYLQCSLASCKR